MNYDDEMMMLFGRIVTEYEASNITKLLYSIDVQPLPFIQEGGYPSLLLWDVSEQERERDGDEKSDKI